VVSRTGRGDRRAWGSAARVAAGTVAYGVVHSALASRQAKDAAARLLGRRQRNGLYRALYNGQAVVTFAVFLWYVARLPDRELYRASGRLALAMRLGQAAALVYAVAVARTVGLGGITGLAGLVAWVRSRAGVQTRPAPEANLRADARVAARPGQERGAAVPPEPEAQGPSLAADGRLRVAGPFRWSRHPLNFAPVPVFWLAPRMTLKRAVFSAVATAYLVLGSWHEEARLGRAYGEVYRAYRRSGVPFFVPRPRRGVRDTAASP
jgi:methanethiol S-methyltransferase